MNQKAQKKHSDDAFWLYNAIVFWFESRHSDHEKTVDFCRRSFAMPLFMLGCRIFGKGKSHNYTHKIKLSDKTFYTCYNINCKKGAI